jgi:YHS domain-containing protein
MSGGRHRSDDPKDTRQGVAMKTTRPTTLVDPVCGMTVDVHTAEHSGLLLEFEGRTYAFCRSGCLRAFRDDAAEYVARAKAETVDASPTTAVASSVPVIDEGMRRWYESCSCCLSDAYPDVKAQLDAERAQQAQAPLAPGICEVAEAHA